MMVVVENKRVLYVEDNEDTAAAVKLILSMAGFTVHLAFTGEDGLRLAFDEQYDVILLDVMLPDMSGWDIFAQLKQKVSAKYIFMSAIPVSEERYQKLRLDGVSDYITKPFAKKDLIERVLKAVHQE
ncbi:MAG: response regulator [archaeon]